MISPQQHRGEKPTAIFSRLGAMLTQGSFTDSFGREVLRGYQITDPRDALRLEEVGLRIPFELIKTERHHLRAWEHELTEAGLDCTIAAGHIKIAARDKAGSDIDHQLVDRFERSVALMVYQRSEIPLIMPSVERANDLMSVPQIAFASVDDWRPFLPRSVVELAENLYGERALFQCDSYVWLRFPSRIPVSVRFGDATDQVCRFAQKHGFDLKVTDDVRLEIHRDPPTAHDLASIVQLRADFTQDTRDQRIAAFLGFAHRLMDRCSALDPIWQRQAEAVLNGGIPSLVLPPFPLWCNQLPNEVFWRLPLASKLTHPMFDEGPGYVSVTLPYQPGREHVSAPREKNARETGVTYTTSESAGVPIERFEVQFARGGRNKALLGLIRCMNRCFLNTPGPRWGDDRPFEGA